MLNTIGDIVQGKLGSKSEHYTVWVGAVFALVAGLMVGWSDEVQSKPIEIRISWSVTPQHI